MKHKKTAVILATGGIGLVRAAYSSGKPAFGVGPGNVPVFIERSADVVKAVRDILTGTCFDNGTICASEQAVVCDAPIAGEVREQFKLQGAHFLNESDAEKVGRVLITDQRTLNAKIVGRSAEYIANLAGIAIPSGTRCLIADCGGVGRDFPWSFEKLSPTLAFFVADGVEAGAAKCEEILRFGGMGHTAGMHTRSREAAVRYGEQMPASRVIINSPTTHGAIGFSTDLSPSMTLGCGSWGGNVTSDNVSPIHLMDIKRVAFESRPVSGGNVKAVSSPAADVAARKPAADSSKRSEIAAIVDRFLSQKLKQPDPSPPAASEEPAAAPPPTASENGPVKTVIHELRAASETPDAPKVVDFVSETDVRAAIDAGKRIYIDSKTILTPSARDLGNEKEIFATVK
jgi:hypothetical protein